MTFFIEVKEEVWDFLDKLDASVSLLIVKKIKRLKENPGLQGKRISPLYRELKHSKFRVYFRVEDNKITIEEVVYDGKVFVEKVGDKKSQKQDIISLS
jgi:mRNA-degrading endonuclease RelE of RelBE toxin-antitoxin system